jgi:hypothetical protein
MSFPKRYLVRIGPKQTTHLFTDALIVGGGIADEGAGRAPCACRRPVPGGSTDGLVGRFGTAAINEAIAAREFLKAQSRAPSPGPYRDAYDKCIRQRNKPAGGKN